LFTRAPLHAKLSWGSGDVSSIAGRCLYAVAGMLLPLRSFHDKSSAASTRCRDRVALRKTSNQAKKIFARVKTAAPQTDLTITLKSALAGQRGSISAVPLSVGIAKSQYCRLKRCHPSPANHLRAESPAQRCARRALVERPLRGPLEMHRLCRAACRQPPSTG